MPADPPWMWVVQASRSQKDAEGLIRKAQSYMRETQASAKKSAAIADNATRQLAAAREALRKRQVLR